jgi:hypothetical protein
MEDPRDPGYVINEVPYMDSGMLHGGRKTNGTAVTEPIRVLYDGPRKFVGLLETTIYDHFTFEDGNTAEDIPLVKVIYTIIFNKVKKEVNILKDVKSLLVEKVALSMKVQLSNRGEVDLGCDDTGYSSFAHFFVDYNGQGYPTVYNDDWVIDTTEDPEYEGDEWEGFGMGGPYPQPAPGMATVDVAQAMNFAAGVVWWAAFWPSLSDWSIDGWNEWWHSLDAADPHPVDGIVQEPFIPFYIGEWDFVLWHVGDIAGRTQFRGVTQYGVVYGHDAVDNQVLDSEVKYYLDEKFNPWDLGKSVNKKYARWVSFEDGPFSVSDQIPLHVAPGLDKGWERYCTFAERILLMPDGVLLVPGIDYLFDGTTITLLIPVTADQTLKILWSTGSFDFDWGLLYEGGPPIYFSPVTGRYEWVVVGRDAASVDSAGAALVAAAMKNKGIEIGTAGVDMMDPMIANAIPWVMAKFGEGDMMTDYHYDHAGGDHRTALKDDWCTMWPVASSNMIGVGGPLANVLTWYSNDFTAALFGLAPFAGSEIWAGEIAASTCWNKNSYVSSEATGYAVVSTYKDINGTVLFLVWGHWGRDTFYATKWLYGGVPYHEPPGIIQLQEAMMYRPGLTDIVLEIDYTDPDHPTFSIVECLGTISETEWVHFNDIYMEWPEEKGGIHDP